MLALVRAALTLRDVRLGSPRLGSVCGAGGGAALHAAALLQA
jgi:hypothetical protein